MTALQRWLCVAIIALHSNIFGAQLAQSNDPSGTSEGLAYLDARREVAQAIQRLESLIGAGTETGRGFAVCPACGAQEQAVNQLKGYRDLFMTQISLGWKLLSREVKRREELTTETFIAAQWINQSEAGLALARMSARLRLSNDAMSPLIRQREDLSRSWHASKSAVVELEIRALDDQLGKEFPRYLAFATPRAVPLTEVQDLLGVDEALMLTTDAPNGQVFVWVVTKTGMRWVRSDLGTPALTREVAALRCGLDATAWNGPQCPELTGRTYTDADRTAGNLLPFDHARAHKLYTALFGEVRDLIKDRHLLLVPSGPLTQLPFQVLVTALPPLPALAGRGRGEGQVPGSEQAAAPHPGHSPGAGPDPLPVPATGRTGRGDAPADHGAIRWLARDHALTVLPAVSSLKALRRTSRPSAAKLPMIGFGNPLLDGNQSHPQYAAYFKQQAALARAHKGCAQTVGQRTAALRGLSQSPAPLPQQSGLADPAQLRRQSPLPETADELCAVARDLKADVAEIRLGARATEREVKALSASGRLADYRILHFATHGTLAGQLSGTNEPGLILTPPEKATEDDDGYLSAGEIAGLKLDADWVILSACNTAGGAGGAGGAEALGGLARAFFYAQARALLVSHWEVDSDATVKLITSAVGAISRDRSVGRAEALRRAMLAMIDTGKPREAHPATWAPFVVVGEGGAGR